MDSIQELVKSLERTVQSTDDLQDIFIVIGIDMNDVFFDDERLKPGVTNQVLDLFVALGIPRKNLSVEKLRSHYRGKLCRIWDLLSEKAFDSGCEFILLIGDDVRFLTEGWKSEIEQVSKMLI